MTDESLVYIVKDEHCRNLGYIVSGNQEETSIQNVPEPGGSFCLSNGCNNRKLAL